MASNTPPRFRGRCAKETERQNTGEPIRNFSGRTKAMGNTLEHDVVEPEQVADGGEKLFQRPAAVGVDRGTSPGRKPPFWAVKRPAGPYKSAIQNRFTV